MEKKFDVASDRIYDEFEPISRWTSEPGFETLTIYLPGFKKEHLKVQVTSTRKLRVMGERPAGGNKWLRFRKEFPMPANVDVDAVSAKFESVSLVVKLPRPEQKGKQLPSGDRAAKPPVHNGGPKPPVQQLPRPAEKEEAPKGAEKVQKPSKPPMEKPGVRESPMEKPGEKKEASRGAEKVHPPEPAMEKPSEKEPATEKRAEKEEASRDAEKIKEKEKPNDGFQGSCCKVGGYKNVLRGYLREMKNNRRAMSVGLVFVASMVVFSLGIYAGKRLRSSFGG